MVRSDSMAMNSDTVLFDLKGNDDSIQVKEGSLPAIADKVKLTGRVLQTLITRVAEIVDDNPAKVALGFVKAIIHISQVSTTPVLYCIEAHYRLRL